MQQTFIWINTPTIRWINKPIESSSREHWRYP